MRRRDFVRSLPVLTTGIVAGAASLPLTGCAGVPYVVPRVRPGGLLVTRAAVSEGGAFVQAPGMDRPVFVVADGAGGFDAVLASCTHQGCQPGPVGERLVCPCHGSEFSFDGRVLQGPAERPLARYEVTQEGDELVVWLERGVGR